MSSAGIDKLARAPADFFTPEGRCQSCAGAEGPV